MNQAMQNIEAKLLAGYLSKNARPYPLVFKQIEGS